MIDRNAAADPSAAAFCFLSFAHAPATCGCGNVAAVSAVSLQPEDCIAAEACHIRCMAGEETFELGLAMAGAISAGAYSAGVFDFLAQALSEWEAAKSRDAALVPNHRVVIKVISGASAGAITGAVGTIA